MTKSQRLYLTDLLDRIHRIMQIAAAGETAFRNSSIYQDAAIRNFEVIGEIVKRLDPQLTTRYPTLDWSDYAGFRDVLIHRYDQVLLDIVWQATQNDLEPLRAAVQAILDSLPPEESQDGE